MKLARSLLFPYLKRFWLMLLSIILVGAFGCGILIGLRNAYHSVDEGINLLLNECGYPDLYVKTIDDVDPTYLIYQTTLMSTWVLRKRNIVQHIPLLSPILITHILED